MKQKLLLVLCFAMCFAIDSIARQKTYIYTYTGGSPTDVFIRYIDIMRDLGFTIPDGSSSVITSADFGEVTVDGTPVSITAANGYNGDTSMERDYVVSSYSLRMRCINTHLSNGHASSNSSNVSSWYGFRIDYPRSAAHNYMFHLYIQANKYSTDIHDVYVVLNYNSTYAKAVRFVESPTSTTKISGPLSTTVGTAYNLYTYSPGNGIRELSITSSNKSNATIVNNYSVSGTGNKVFEFVGNKVGTYTVNIHQYVSSNSYFESDHSINIVVNRKPASLTFAKGNVESPVSSLRGASVASINTITGNQSGGAVTYSVTRSNGTTVTLTNGCLPEDLPAGTYTVKATSAQTDMYNSATATYTLTASLEKPELKKVVSVKKGEPLELTSIIRDYKSGMNASFSCDDANANVSGTTFVSNVNGEYIVNVSSLQTDVYLALNNEPVRVIVSDHEHGRVNLHVHYDRTNTNVGSSVSTFKCVHECYFIPEWDFVSTEGSGYPFRFCINEDGETVTLVSGIPISDRAQSSKSYNIPDLNTHTHVTHGRQYDEDWEARVQDFYYYDPHSELINAQRVPTHSLIPLIANQNYIEYDDLVQFYNVTGDVTVPEKVTYKGKEYTVNTIGVCAFHPIETTSFFDEPVDPRNGRFVNHARNVNLPKSIKLIGGHSFEKSEIESLNFTDLENLERIDGNAFNSTSRLYTVDLSYCLKLENIGNKAFYLSNVKDVNMSGLPVFLKNEPKYKGDWKHVFELCNNLESADLSNMPYLSMIGEGEFYTCRNLPLKNLRLEGSAIWRFCEDCFLDCVKFKGGTLDLRKLAKKSTSNGEMYPILFESQSFAGTDIGNIICDHEIIGMNSAFIGNYDPLNIFLLKPQPYLSFYSRSNKKNISIFTAMDHVFETWTFGNSNYPDVRNPRYGGYSTDNILTDSNNDEFGPRVFPIIRSNTSGVRTMSYFRPLDYKNIKVFDNTHIYESNKSDGTDYKLEDFFRTDLTGIEMLTPYTATDYDVENKQVTMTGLSSSTSGIPTKGGIYYKGTGTSTDGADNEILYILTEPEYSLSGDNKLYANMYSGTNYLKGGGKDAVKMTGAPHKTETSTQFISKGGTFYYCTGGTLGAFKAYLDLPEFIYTAADDGYGSQLTKVSSLSFVWNDEEDDTATAVDAIKENSPVTKDYFNMQGMKVKTPVSGGIYIHNGRKVLVK